jgi:hypothetical protein
MARIDIVSFPKLIIQIPTDEFPDKIKIVMTGRVVPKEGNAKTADLVAKAKKLANLPALPTMSATTWTETSFKKEINGQKTAELKAPYDEVESVVAYAHRKDTKNEDPINVRMFTSRQNQAPSSSKESTVNLENVWATYITLSKQKIDSNYIVQYVSDTISLDQVASVITPFTTFFGDIISKLMVPSLPTPKAIASKLLGPAAAVVQSALATAAEQYAKIKPTVDQLVSAAQAVVSMVQNPEEIVTYLPLLMTFLLQFIPQETLAEVVYEYHGDGS